MTNEYWTILGVIIAAIGLISAWYFFFRSKTELPKKGDGGVVIGKGGEAGNINTKVTKTGLTSSSGDGGVDTGAGSKVKDITTDISKTDGPM